MRVGVNWENINRDTAPQVLRINISRFTQYVVKTKAMELLCRYINAQLEVGAKVEQVGSRLDCIMNFVVVGPKHRLHHRHCAVPHNTCETVIREC